MMEALFVALILISTAGFCVVWIGEKIKLKRLQSDYADLKKRFRKYMQKHEHCRSCDLCDLRTGCPGYIGPNRTYIACPFFEHKAGGANNE